MGRAFICFLLLVSFSLPLHVSAGNRNVITAKYVVNGVCGKCKQRIEDAAYIKGVKYADWDIDSHNLMVKYDSTKTSPDLILQSIARAGHDTEDYKATDEDYNKLPLCCRYRSGIKRH